MGRTCTSVRTVRAASIACSAGAAMLLAGAAPADEGGLAFWASGQFSSLSAVPSDPGWSLPFVYEQLSADAGVAKSFLRGGNLVARKSIRRRGCAARGPRSPR